MIDGKLLVFLTLLIFNVYGFFLMWTDKKRAIRKQRRINEKSLWFVAFFGGAVGATLGMRTFRHKTKHTNFKYGLPLLSCIQVIVFTYFLGYLS